MPNVPRVSLLAATNPLRIPEEQEVEEEEEAIKSPRSDCCTDFNVAQMFFSIAAPVKYEFPTSLLARRESREAYSKKKKRAIKKDEAV